MIYLNSPLFLLNLLTCITLFLCYALFRWFPPKKINALYGYRTARSMQSDAHWNHAQKKFAHLALKWGGSFVVISAISLFIPPMGLTSMVMGLLIMIGVFLWIAFLVERSLKKRFELS